MLLAMLGCLSVAAQSLKGDVNGDNRVDIGDVVTILEIIANGGSAETSKAPAGVEAIDLGLPSGTLWANMNVGAEKPEDYGLYFAWGETTGYTSDTSDGRSFDWASYKWMAEGQSSWKYINKYQIDDGQTEGCWYQYLYLLPEIEFVGDRKTVLDAEDDAAAANWGGRWVMPTYEEITELLDNTEKEWNTINGVNGLKFKSKVNGKSIFLPASGYRTNDKLETKVTGGNYWSASLSTAWSAEAYRLVFNSKGVDTENNSYFRYGGRTVRPVIRK